ncbi:hypothetical protein [Blastopirellula marina]|uniref:SLA1 homology domain-containing protein n=1 Tax=Blastopirellula marina TaxID=124 RepID=A0A2S8G0Y7_9BACT|nr:hypothetical protein [Blastopirellula marina]PQO38115.1 hypothetical protein C5Y98_08525 [Blastopirellula marina]PTL44771.1 hypothetical protein C5Y97_08525 [Blastopirellula marina]
MLASRHFLLVPIFVCLMTAWVFAQESREWTDKGGKKLTGTFVKMSAEDKVSIKGADGGDYIIPLSAFIDADQQYVKQIIANKNKPAPPEVKGKLEDDRLWTNFKGQSMTGHFVRMKDGFVVLMRGNKGQPVSFYLLSQPDQDWLRKQLSLRGESNLILSREEMDKANPTIHQELDDYMSKLAATTGGGNPSATQPSSRPAPYTPPTGDAYVPPSETPYNPPSENNASDFQSPGGGQPSGMQPGSNELAANVPVGAENSGNPSSETGSSGAGNRFRSNPAQDVEPGYCPGCRQELPVGYGPGDHCPRCNFFLEDWVQPGTGAPIVAWYESSTLWYTVGGALLVLGFLALGAKKFNG